MVEDSITRPRRVAELLASEFTGLEEGPLAGLAVVDARPDASATPGGSEAYALEYRSRRVGAVSLYPGHVAVSLSVEAAALPGETPLPVESTGEGVRVRVEDGVAVKRAVDVVRSALGAAGD
jgi:hypothetical protein